MFSNLSKREKILSALVGSLVPIVLVFLAGMNFISTYNLRKTQIAGIQNRIDAEFQKKLDASQSNMRRNFYYKLQSLPSNYQRAIVTYRDWLEDMIRDNGMTFGGIRDPESTEVVFRDRTTGSVTKVASKFEYNFTSSGSLDQIMKFIYEFEQLKLLQKITSLTIKPLRSRDVLSGRHSATFKIEVLSLVDADEDRDFLAAKKELPTSFEEYEGDILARNIFGPANNPPTLSLARKSFYPDDDISIPLSGKDLDDNDQLTYEIVDAGEIAGLEVEQDEGENRATLKCPPLEIGEYAVTLRVTDNGFPAKSSETECKIVVKEKPLKEEKIVIEKPDFKHSTQTQIKRISAREGVFEVKIAVRTTGEVFELGKGDSFELDSKTWTVRNIDVHSLTLEVDGKLLEFKQGAFLDAPRKETEIDKPKIDKPEIADVSADSN